MNKNRIVPITAGLIAGCIIGLGIIFVTATDRHLEKIRKLREEPQFRTGECLQKKPDPEMESWELPSRQIVYMITKVGQKAYRVTYSIGDGEHVEIKLTFFSQEFYEKVDCDQY